MKKNLRVASRKTSFHDKAILIVPLLLGAFLLVVLASQLQTQFDGRSSAQVPGSVCIIKLKDTQFMYSCRNGYKAVSYTCTNGAKGVYGGKSLTTACLTKEQLTKRATQLCNAQYCPPPTSTPQLTPQPSFPPGYTPRPSISPRPTTTSFPPPTSTTRPSNYPTPTSYPLRSPTPTPRVTGAPSTPFPPPTPTSKPL